MFVRTSSSSNNSTTLMSSTSSSSSSSTPSQSPSIYHKFNIVASAPKESKDAGVVLDDDSSPDIDDLFVSDVTIDSVDRTPSTPPRKSILSYLDTGLPNPGMSAYYDHEIKSRLNVQQEFHEGAKFRILSNLTPDLNILHQVHLVSSQQEQASYTMTAILANETHRWQATITPGQYAQAVMSFQPRPNISCRLTSTFIPSMNEPNIAAETDYMGPDFSANLKLVRGQETRYEGTYLQSVAEGLAIGAQLEHVPSKRETGAKAFGKFTYQDMVMSAEVSTQGVGSVNLMKIVSERMIGVMSMTLAPWDLKANVKGGFEYHGNSFVSQMVIDSDGTVVSHIKTELLPKINYHIVAMMNAPHNFYKFGISMTINE